ncbi:putative acetamidase/formamidase [Terriglobus roseus DSM 18391]|uniref:Putative acetamidase/formamidase n=1 Tax=Terriglobus roseus (strain DSM 18391 / NRRL B-41598 / KBS 63) TaxID=926566 RepID=I3ZFM7_TERRK|nr:acetamidase/formamidase family protein [Terriglobus roseus]AFL88045.1 putative acetamidase/formamidase [Terriglobus roseus DSM 18391]
MKLLSAAILFAATASAQQPNAGGKWITNIDTFGTPTNWNLTLEQNGDHITGELGGDKLEGSLKNGKLSFHAKDPQGGYEDVTATVSGDTITGSLVWAQNAAVSHPTTHTFTATRAALKTGVAPQPTFHDFTPTVFRRQFSAAYEPVLTVNSGDTIHTWTVDAAGYDATGTPRSLGGNPQTGPFFINGAAPGDVLAIHIRRLRLNRDWAISTNSIVDRANPPGIARRLTDSGVVRWHLDLEKGLASPEKPGPHMATYSVPLKPMLGCIGVATDPSGPAPRTGDSGNFGGNMDFNEVTEGATLYLPVRVAGALLYLGDGHAVQGDGETTGDALETSMDVTVTVEVVHDVPIRGPFLETPTHLMAIGLDGSIDAAFQDATERMENYLARVYKLTPSEFAMVLGTAAEYKVSEVADRNAGVILKMAKSKLDTLTKPVSQGQANPASPTITP